jgi:hypothetical protein
MFVEGPSAVGLPACLAPILALALASAGQVDKGSPSPSKDARSRGERLLALHTEHASSYSIYRDAAKTQRLELKREPIYRWSNPTRSGGQEGDVFLWTYGGRPEVIASIFSHPLEGHPERRLCHELQSLSEAVLVVDRDSPNRWEPRAPGIELKPVPGAPPPAASASQRAIQIRALAREFSGRSLSEAGQAWELRLLPKPLYRYESPEVLDGFILALVSTAGTDPEIILLLEARKTPEGPRWLYAPTRFSDMNLWLKHKDQEVWSAIRGGENTFNHDALHRYRFFQDLIVPEIEAESPSAASEAKKAEAK